MPSVVYLGLGSNLGDRVRLIREAVRRLAATAAVRLNGPTAVASLYETQPVTEDVQPAYLNTVVQAETTLLPEELLRTVLAIEAALGRERRLRWEPRLIDMDLLLFDDLCLRTDTLEIPHPRLHLRQFVLEPLSEIGGDVVHPVLGIKIADLRDELRRTAPQQGALRIAGPDWWHLDAPRPGG